MADIDFTIFGGSGFIGRRLAAHLRAAGASVSCPSRTDIADGTFLGRDLGHVIYAIGLTADFRTRLSETVEAHVGLLDRLMQTTRWSSWLFLSSTRVYGAVCSGVARTEEDAIAVRPSLDAVYDLSKLLGESLVLARDNPACRVARLSNVFGIGMPEGNFLASLARDAIASGKVTVRENPASGKDYVAVDHVVQSLIAIAERGKERVYNVASGERIEHRTLAGLINRTLGADVSFGDGGATRKLPLIDVDRLKSEFGAAERDVTSEIENTLRAMLVNQEPNHV